MCGLPHNAFIAVNGLILLLLFARETVGSSTRQAAVILANIDRRHRRAQIMSQKLKDVSTQHIECQLTQYLFGQFALTVAQPGDFLQTLGIDFLQPEVFAVGGRKRQQITSSDIRQDSADNHHEYQIQADGKNGTARDLCVAGQPKLLFHFDSLIVLGADLISNSLATSGEHSSLIVAVVAPQIDHLLSKRIPLLLHRGQTPEPVLLRRVVFDQTLESVQLGNQQRFGDFIGVEEVLIAGQQKTAHAGFHVYRQFHRTVGVIDHPVSVLDPLYGREQITDQQNEENGAQYPHTQWQAYVTPQQFSKALLIDNRRPIHEISLTSGSKP